MIRHRLIPRVTPRTSAGMVPVAAAHSWQHPPGSPGPPDFGSTMEVEEFTPVSFAANDADVLTVVRFRGRSRSKSKTAEMNLHHYCKFGDGKIACYRGTEDTAQTETVLRD
jgi:hypothetical protein